MDTPQFQKDNDTFQTFTRGDKRALSYYFDFYYSRLLYYALSLTKELGVSEEIVSEAFVKLWRERERIKEESKVKNLLYLVVRNECFNHLRKQKTALRHKPMLQYLAQKQESSRLESLVEAETYNRIFSLLKALPPRSRHIFEAFYLQQKSLKEIAEELNLTVSATKSQKHRATSLLKKMSRTAGLNLMLFQALTGLLPLFI